MSRLKGKLGLLLITIVSIGLFLVLAAWGWGSVSRLLAHPVRAGAYGS
jgi:small-conductance mechanosensitive channel